MNAFEKEVAEREALTPLYSYPYEVEPISEQAVSFFSIYCRGGGPIPQSKAEFERIKKDFKLDKSPFVGQMTFYYDDPRQSEQERIRTTKNAAIKNMADRHVPGIYHHNSPAKNPYFALVEGQDYEVKVGEKIVHEQPERLSFDNIKAL